MSEKNYIGRGQPSGKYPDNFKYNLCLSSIPKENVYTSPQGKEYITFFSSPLKEIDERGNSFCMYTIPKSDKASPSTATSNECPF